MYIYGKNVVNETIDSGTKIVKAYVSSRSHDNELVSKLKKNKVRIHFVDDNVLGKMVDGKHQGFVLEVDEVKTYSLDDLFDSHPTEKPIVVIFDHLNDTHNFGAIIRTCEALGIDGIIIPNDRSVGVTSSVVKTSAGAINYMKIIRVSNLNVAISKLKEHGYWIVGTDMDGEDYTLIDYDVPVGLVIGNEGSGISKVVRNACDYVASIPMSGKINSLNASVSCGIILGEIVRKRRQL